MTNILKYKADEFYVHAIDVHRMEDDFIYVLDPEDGECTLDLDLF